MKEIEKRRMELGGRKIRRMEARGKDKVKKERKETQKDEITLLKDETRENGLKLKPETETFSSGLRKERKTYICETRFPELENGLNESKQVYDAFFFNQR